MEKKICAGITCISFLEEVLGFICASKNVCAGSCILLFDRRCRKNVCAGVISFLEEVRSMLGFGCDGWVQLTLSHVAAYIKKKNPSG
jgi:hypothetical protein